MQNNILVPQIKVKAESQPLLYLCISFPYRNMVNENVVLLPNA